MKAAVFDGYGASDVLEVRDVAVPVPGRGELLVRVHAAALNPKDLMIRKGGFKLLTGARFPKGIGFDWAGTVVASSSSVEGFPEGTALFGLRNGWRGGTCAELLSVRAAEAARKPHALDWNHAAALPLVGLTALQALRDVAGLKPGQRVVIHGASGGVGLPAIAIAKRLGAHVTTTSSARHLALCREAGADLAIDYAKDSILEAARPCNVFFDVYGNQSFEALKPVLTRRGMHVSTAPKRGVPLHPAHIRIRSGCKRRCRAR